MKPNLRKTLLLATLLVVVLPAPPALADDAEDTDFDHFSIRAGIFFTDRDSKTRLNGSLGDLGTIIDLESDLGLDSSDSVFRLDGTYRFNERHSIDLSLFDLSRQKTRVIDEEIEWGDSVYPINATLKSEFDVIIYKLAYTWSFFRRDKGHIGLTGGLYIASFGTSLREVEVDLGSVESDTLTAPLPVIGLRGEYEIADRWTFRASGELFGLEYEEYDGSLLDLYAGVDYQLSEHAAIGIGLNSVVLDVGITRERFDGNFDWRYDGALLFVKFDF